MWEDQALLRELWDAKLPVQFTLSTEEISSLEKPKPFYVLIPRMSYFPLVLEKVQRYFLSFIKQDDSEELWLDYEGIPIKWHYPIGVIFDQTNLKEENMPWKLTVHFKKYPEKELLHCRMNDVVESHFMQSLKEADQIKHRGEVIEKMQKQDHKQLWTGLASDRFDQFWSVNKRLMEHSQDLRIRHVPIRLYRPEPTFQTEPSLKSYPSSSLVIQRLCKPFVESGERVILSEVLKDIAPEFADESSWSMISHGVDLPYDTPLPWLCINLTYPDNFVHISIRRKETVAPTTEAE